MSMQTCCRDQRKMGQVIDQMKILAKNLDELRSEIDALKVHCVKKEDGFLRQTGDMKNSILRKFKRYVRKVASIRSLKSEGKSDGQETYYPCTNSDVPMPSFLNYIFRIGKRGDVWQIPARVKYLKDEGNQTDGTPEDHVEKLGNQGSEFKRSENTENKIPPKKYVTLATECSDISCELDSRVETPFSSAINLPSNLSTTQMEPSSQNIQTSSLKDINKQFTAASTQTSIPTLRNRKIIKSRSKNPHLYFSKIKNAVIAKKIIRNSNECIFPVCRNDYPCSKDKCPCDKKKMDNIRTIGKIDEKFSLDKIIHKLDEEDSFSLVDLEVNVSDSSNEVDEFFERRKPRTYIVRKTSQNRNQDNWSSHFEKSVIYVGSTSDLSLFSHSFLN